MNLKIIGISGTNGAGKDSFGQILAKYHGYMFITVSDFLRDEAKKRDLKPEREALRQISAEWRRQKGLGVLVDMALDKFKKTGQTYQGLVVGSLRNRGETAAVKKAGGQIIWIDANPKLRYERVIGRARDAESRITFDQFLADEATEMQPSGDDATLGLTDVRDMADVTIANNTKTLNQLRQTIEKTLRL